MTEPDFCPEAAPSGALCGVAYGIVHSRHFALDGSTWTTEQPHRPVRIKAVDWLWEALGIDPDRVGPDRFRQLIREYDGRRYREQWQAPPVLTVASRFAEQVGEDTPLVIRPCPCCGCGDGTVCFHGGEHTGCMWGGPGR